jgi:hypothetical protein
LQKLAVINNGTGLPTKQLFERGEQTRLYTKIASEALHKLNIEPFEEKKKNM